ncbi:histidine phosphatase family protein, partial [Pseudomonas sp. GW704-F3]|uniref:histidine phosphatase family protein n=1 Tax=Pseudomonas sp. GW704-F3 TaxID=2070574 RepID=UPI000CB39A4F
MRLYIVRHGQTAWNLEGRAQGHTDIPLDLHGQRQAARLAERFAGVDVSRVMCSDLI